MKTFENFINETYQPLFPFTSASQLMQNFINDNRDKIINIIKKTNGMKNVPLNDDDLVQWIHENEELYNLAKSEGVDIDEIQAQDTSEEDLRKYQEEEERWLAAKKTEKYD